MLIHIYICDSLSYKVLSNYHGKLIWNKIKISAWQMTQIWYVNNTLRISYAPVHEVLLKREQMVFTRKITINHLHSHCSHLLMSVLKKCTKRIIEWSTFGEPVYPFRICRVCIAKFFNSKPLCQTLRKSIRPIL